MKITLILIMLSISALAEYQKGKIDMHGGKESYPVNKDTRAFKSPSMGMSLFLDKNSSKKSQEKRVGK